MKHSLSVCLPRVKPHPVDPLQKNINPDSGSHQVLESGSLHQHEEAQLARVGPEAVRQHRSPRDKLEENQEIGIMPDVVPSDCLAVSLTLISRDTRNGLHLPLNPKQVRESIRSSPILTPVIATLYIVELVLHMAHFQLGWFLIGLVSNGARLKLHSFLMVSRIRSDKRETKTWMTTLAPN